MRTKTAKWIGGLALVAAVASSSTARAFCGFYVGGADTKLFNNATMVVLMREGTRTVLSMQNNYQGPPSQFAMVVPVPVVLQKDNVKTLPREVFARIDQLAAPRLVEYWEQDPCQPFDAPKRMNGAMLAKPAAAPAAEAKEGDLGVKIEAQFSVAEYEIVILSAEDSGGLDKWLRLNGYKIPEGAEPVLRPYVAQGMKFFVAKVDPTKVKFEGEQAQLSPLRFHYDSDTFSLPVRLGLLNSSGTQDLVVHLLARNKRFEVANYPNVTIPTNLEVNENAREQFGEFYAALFDRTVEEHPGAIVTEYSWDASTCDPCPGPAMNPSDFLTLGADALGNDKAPELATDPTWVASVKVGAPQDPKAAAAVAQSPWIQAQAQRCYNEALKVAKAPHGTVNATVTAHRNGPREAKLQGTESFPATFGTCLQGAVQAVRLDQDLFDKPIAFPITFNVRGPEPGEKGWWTPPPPNLYGFTLTRLHARYKKDALGQDLVFKEAPGIVGGREDFGQPKQSTDAKPAPMNNFQGRYVIRHPWKGPVTCESPHFGVWGGPPSGMGYAPPRAATNTAFAPRGKTKLASFFPPDTPAPTNPPSTVPTNESSPSASKGCGGCATSSDDRTTSRAAWLVAAIVAAWGARRVARSRRT